LVRAALGARTELERADDTRAADVVGRVVGLGSAASVAIHDLTSAADLALARIETVRSTAGVSSSDRVGATDLTLGWIVALGTTASLSVLLFTKESIGAADLVLEKPLVFFPF